MDKTVKEELTANEKPDFMSAMSVIAEVENSSDKGNYNLLKERLGHDMFKKMATLGFIRGGFYILNGKIVDTYAVTQSYKEWEHILNKTAKSKKKPRVLL